VSSYSKQQQQHQQQSPPYFAGFNDNQKLLNLIRGSNPKIRAIKEKMFTESKELNYFLIFSFLYYNE
jgi:hypothetical protein